MRPRRITLLGVSLGWLLATAPADAIMSGEASKLAPSSNPDYAAGKAAFLAED